MEPLKYAKLLTSKSFNRTKGSYKPKVNCVYKKQLMNVVATPPNPPGDVHCIDHIHDNAVNEKSIS